MTTQIGPYEQRPRYGGDEPEPECVVCGCHINPLGSDVEDYRDGYAHRRSDRNTPGGNPFRY